VEVPDRQLKNEARIDLVGEFSKSRRVEGSRTLLDFDVTDFLTLSELEDFRMETGLRSSPVTLVLPSQAQHATDPTAGRNRVVVAFLHGFGGGRGSWGIRKSSLGREGGIVDNVLRAVQRQGKEAIGLVLAGLGRDGGNVDAAMWDLGLTPEHYSRQLEYALRHLGLYDCGRIIGIGHSLGAAALWEFAGRNFTSGMGPMGREGRRPELSLVSISPVRSMAPNTGLTLGCRVAGQGLDLFARTHLRLWHSSSQRLRNLVGMASVLKGLARQGPFRANLGGIKGLVLIGERDWIARMGLSASLRQAGCTWPVAQLTGLGHDLLWHPATARALTFYMPRLL
jgi:pimeloyl-ACP methyl ester carboxylesterase